MSTPAASGPASSRNSAPVLVGAVAVLAWLALAAWSASPYARYLGHGAWLDDAWFAELCTAVPRGDVLVPALLHSASWLLMIAAMMVPTTLPLVNLFARVTGRRSDAASLRALLVAGYGLSWLIFGLVAHGADAVLHRALSSSGWLAAHGWVAGSVVLAGAGAFQFSALKYQCLERCRTPFGFINARWRGLHPARESLRIGFDHGLFCVGCCWALMLVMFVVGMGSLGWMLVLALAMAIEKNLPWGRRVSAPLGIGLLGAAAAVVVANL